MRKQRSAWNKGRLLGQKPPLKPTEIWSLEDFRSAQWPDRAGELQHPCFEDPKHPH